VVATAWQPLPSHSNGVGPSTSASPLLMLNSCLPATFFDLLPLASAQEVRARSGDDTRAS
jgi:hypothetical protein